jgi:hypothetical protein
MLFQMNSIGFKSGEYGGKKISVMLHSSAHFIILNTPQLCCGDGHETDLS